MNKRIYSLNLIAYIFLKTDLEPDIYADENNMFYAVFPECRGVAYAIKTYRQYECYVEIHSYLNCYKVIRERIKDIRGVKPC